MKQNLTMDELRQIFELLLKYAQKWGVKEISFKDEDDYYFKIWHRDRNFEDIEFLNCPNYTIGSLSDDIEGLKSILNGKDEPCTLDLERIGAILTALGATMLEE